jgi:1-acyl-sn-glycerol-3-phosphate acyltransferase
LPLMGAFLYARIPNMLKYPRILLTAGWRLLFDFTFYINRYAKHPERYSIEERYAKVRSLIIYILDHFRIDWKIEGIENLKALNDSSKPFLMAPNHMSDLDPLALVYLSEKPISFVAKKETTKMPFIGTAVKALDGFFMDRDDLRQSLTVIRGVEQKLKEGHCSYIIFPEGTRNKRPAVTGVSPFRPGSFKAAYLGQTPILPVSIYGTFRPFHSNPDYKRNLLQFTFFKPDTYEDYEKMDTVAYANKAHELIQNEVDRQKEIDRLYFEKGYEKIPLRKGPLKIE